MPFIYLMPYALKDSALAFTNATIADAAQHADLLSEWTTCHACLILIAAYKVNLRHRGGCASTARMRAEPRRDDVQT
jgi:hypothetical protein